MDLTPKHQRLPGVTVHAELDTVMAVRSSP